MHNSIQRNIVAFTMVLAFFGSASAMDTVLFTKLANDTIQEAKEGFVTDINRLMAMQKQMLELAVEASKRYIQRHPEHRDILSTVVNNTEAMLGMSLEQIEEQWHQGKFMRSQGFDLDELDHFGELFSLMDSMIHPATSYIALKEYKRTRNTDFLARASAELIEVVEHVAHIGAQGDGTQVSSN